MKHISQSSVHIGSRNHERRRRVNVAGASTRYGRRKTRGKAKQGRKTYDIAPDRKPVRTSFPVHPLIPRCELPTAQNPIRRLDLLRRELRVRRARVDEERSFRDFQVFLEIFDLNHCWVGGHGDRDLVFEREVEDVASYRCIENQYGNVSTCMYEVLRRKVAEKAR